MAETSWAPKPTELMKYRSIFVSALKAYEEKTGKVLSSDPLLPSFEKCHSPSDIFTILRQQIPGIGQSLGRHSSLTGWLTPTVNIIDQFSATTDGAIGLAHTPAGLIFTAIGVLLSTANAVSASQGAALEPFERMGYVFTRLHGYERYVNIPMDLRMDKVVEVLTEVLCIIAIATKEINQNRAKTFLKKLVGRNDIEDAIQRLKNVTAGIEGVVVMKRIRSFRDKAMSVDHKDGQITPKAFEGGMKGVRGTYVRANGTRNKVINSVEKQGRQKATDFHAVAAEGSKAVHGVSDNGRAQESQGAWNRARTLDGTSATKNLVAKSVDDVKNMSPSMESHSAYLSWDLSSSSATEWFSLRDSSILSRYLSRHLSSPSTTEWYSARDASIISRFEDHRDFDGQTLPHYAPSKALVDHTRPSIQQGVDINSRDNQGRTALHQVIIEYPLVDGKELNIIQLLLDHGADIAAQDEKLYTPLHLAAKKGKYAVVQLLIKRGGSIHARGTKISTPLHHASSHGHPDVIQLLLEHGADIEAQNEDVNTPLHLAAWQGKVAAAQKLLEHGARIDARDKLSRTPLHYATWYEQVDVIQFLLEHGADTETQDSNNNTPLHLAACRRKVRATQKLLDHGARIDARDGASCTPLHHASLYGHPDVIQLLLEHDADIETLDQHYHTPLHFAAWHGKVRATQKLLEHGARIDARDRGDRTPLHRASGYGLPNVIQLLLEHGADIEAQDYRWKTPLHYAAGQGKVAATQKLLEHGARIHARDKSSWTPLHHASWHGHPDVIQFLLEHGAEIETRSHNGETPLHLATSQKKAAAVQKLLDHHAMIHVQDNSTRTPIQLASQNGHLDVAQLLRKADLGVGRLNPPLSQGPT